MSDEYVTLRSEHHFDGLLFNTHTWFPQAEVARGVYRFRPCTEVLRNYEEHKKLVSFPQYPGLGIKPSLQQPYYEVGFGIENIFRVFRIDCTWRLSNLNRDVNGDGINDRKVSRFGVQGSFLNSISRAYYYYTEITELFWEKAVHKQRRPSF